MNRLAPFFLTLVALQALMVVLDRTGVPLPFSARAVSWFRLAVALQILAVLAIWAFREWGGGLRSSRSDRSGGG